MFGLGMVSIEYEMVAGDYAAYLEQGAFRLKT